MMRGRRRCARTAIQHAATLTQLAGSLCKLPFIVLLGLALCFAIVNAPAHCASPSDSEKFTLNENFAPVRLDEEDLAHLADTVGQLVDRFGGNLDVSIASADEKETIKTGDRRFFLSPEMLDKISWVEINYGKFDAPVSVSLSLGHYTSLGATLTVEGTDEALVFGVFHEIEQQLNSRRAPLAWLFENHSGLVGLFLFLVGFAILGVIAAAATWSLIALARRIILRTAKEPDAQLLAVTIIIAFFVGGVGLLVFFNACFPSVQFAGRLSDPGAHFRSLLTWVLGFIILPMAVNVLAGLWVRQRPRPGPERRSRPTSSL